MKEKGSRMDSSQLDALLAYVQSDSRVCPLPIFWSRLWEILPGRMRVGAGWNPPAPLILAAWGETTSEEKRERLIKHVRYAAEHDALNEVEKYLRGLTPDQWHYDK